MDDTDNIKTSEPNKIFDLTHFTLKEMTECGSSLRYICSGSKGMEEASERIVRYLYEHLMDKNKEKKGCVLVRFFKTCSYVNLSEELQAFAVKLNDQKNIASETKCLTLLASVGENPHWNSIKNSDGHKVIPLVSENFVSTFPMISNLVRQLGLEINQVVDPRPEILIDISQKKYNVFYVPSALGSNIIPAQDSFVIPFGVKSIIGCGGILPSGDLFTIVMFTKVDITQETAELFKTIALDIKLALLPFENKVITDSDNYFDYENK